jgi:hypothetical protein
MLSSATTPLIISIEIDDIQTEEIRVHELNEVDEKLEEFFAAYGIASPILQSKIKARILMALNRSPEPLRPRANRLPSFSDPDIEYQINPKASNDSCSNGRQTIVSRRLLSELNSANLSNMLGNLHRRPDCNDSQVNSEFLRSSEQSLVFNDDRASARRSMARLEAFKNPNVDKKGFQTDQYLLSEVFNEASKRGQPRSSRTKFVDLRTRNKPQQNFNPQYEYQINQSNFSNRGENLLESSHMSSNLRRRYSKNTKENLIASGLEESNLTSSNLHGSKRASKMQTPLWTYDKETENYEPNTRETFHRNPSHTIPLAEGQSQQVKGVQPVSHHRSVSEHKQFNSNGNKTESHSRMVENRSKSFPKVFDTKTLAAIFDVLDEQGLGFVNSMNFGMGNLSGEDLKFLEPVILKVLTSSRAKKFRFSEFEKLCRNLRT